MSNDDTIYKAKRLYNYGDWVGGQELCLIF